jgi:hypothetical protein
MSKKNDPISPWFIAAEDLGEYIGIRFGRVVSGSKEPNWVFLRHTDFDGIGGFAELLRRHGASLPRLPQIKHPHPPSWLPLARLLPKFLKPRHRVKWRSFNGPVSTSSASQPPSAVAWHVFDESATTQIRRACRKSAFTVNSFLLKHLTKAIRPFLEDESSVIPWMIPVNLRGKVAGARDTDNYSSYIGLKVNSYETAHDIHRNIYDTLGRGEHWANWYSYRASSLTTSKLKKFLLVKGMAMSQWNLGSFSNLGDWDAEKNLSPSCGGPWLFCPPVLRCQLVGAGCVTFQNRLSLVIQAHPELTTDAAIPAAWLQNWLKEIELDVSSIVGVNETSEPGSLQTNSSLAGRDSCKFALRAVSTRAFA